MPILSQVYNTETVQLEGIQQACQNDFLPVNQKLLWVVTLDPSVGEFHGAGMRFLNFSRELSNAGASVYFAVNVWSGDNSEALKNFLDKLKMDGVIAGYILTYYRYSIWQGRLGALAFHPGLTNWLLRGVRRQPADELLSFIKEKQITAAIMSDRMLCFLGLELQRAVPTLFDWTDSMALHYWRALEAKIRRRQFAGLFGFLRDYQTNLIAEFYYGRRADLNLMVSPIDKSWLDNTNFRKARNRVWLNGTRTEKDAAVQKIAKRLIFSGAMDYAPNYEGALWFLDEVWPLVLAKHPDAEFVIAGVNPVPELAARASKQVRVTGFVADLGAEISCSALYVAPLLSGGGFRNKVIESLMKGTYLIGTTISVEFLPAQFRSLLPVADTASGFAGLIVEYLNDPSRFETQLDHLRQIVIDQYSWKARAGDLLGYVAEAISLRNNQ